MGRVEENLSSTRRTVPFPADLLSELIPNFFQFWEQLFQGWVGQDYPPQFGGIGGKFKQPQHMPGRAREIAGIRSLSSGLHELCQKKGQGVRAHFVVVLHRRHSVDYHALAYKRLKQRGNPLVIWRLQGNHNLFAYPTRLDNSDRTKQRMETENPFSSDLNVFSQYGNSRCL